MPTENEEDNDTTGTLECPYESKNNWPLLENTTEETAWGITGCQLEQGDEAVENTASLQFTEVGAHGTQM